MKETAKQYRPTEWDFFLDSNRFLSKESIGVITTDYSGSPIYSSLEPDNKVAITKLQEWYENYVKREINDCEEKIATLRSRLAHLRTLSDKS